MCSKYDFVIGIGYAYGTRRITLEVNTASTWICLPSRTNHVFHVLGKVS